MKMLVFLSSVEVFLLNDFWIIDIVGQINYWLNGNSTSFDIMQIWINISLFKELRKSF